MIQTLRLTSVSASGSRCAAHGSSCAAQALLEHGHPLRAAQRCPSRWSGRPRAAPRPARRPRCAVSRAAARGRTRPACRRPGGSPGRTRRCPRTASWTRPGRARPCFGPGRGRQVAAVDRGAAGGVGDDQAVAEELAEQLDVGRFAAAGAGAGELEQRLQQLRALDVVQRRRPCGRARAGRGRSRSSRVSWSRSGGCGAMLMALSLGSLLFLAGQTSTQSAQPVQSSAATWTRVFLAGQGAVLVVRRLEGGRRFRPDRSGHRPWCGWPRAGRPARTCCTGCR